MAADCGGKRGCTPRGRGTMPVGECTGLELLRLAIGWGAGLPAASKGESRESLDGQRGLIGSLKQAKRTESLVS